MKNKIIEKALENLEGLDFSELRLMLEDNEMAGWNIWIMYNEEKNKFYFSYQTSSTSPNSDNFIYSIRNDSNNRNDIYYFDGFVEKITKKIDDLFSELTGDNIDYWEDNIDEEYIEELQDYCNCDEDVDKEEKEELQNIFKIYLQESQKTENRKTYIEISHPNRVFSYQEAINACIEEGDYYQENEELIENIKNFHSYEN
ncbi:hypothetical protein EOM09_01910 [bacterium]|nr:hypothetical protein [bacterium]